MPYGNVLVVIKNEGDSYLLAIGRSAFLSTYLEANPDKCMTWEVFHNYMKYAHAFLSRYYKIDGKPCEPFYTFLPRKYEDNSNRESRKAMAYQNIINFASSNIKFVCYQDKIQLSEHLTKGFTSFSSITEPDALRTLYACACMYRHALETKTPDDIMQSIGLDVFEPNDSRFDDSLDMSSASFECYPYLLEYPGADFYKEGGEHVDVPRDTRNAMYQSAAKSRAKLNDERLESYFGDPMHLPDVSLSLSMYNGLKNTP